jgi:nicotinamide-nucleotide amidase
VVRPMNASDRQLLSLAEPSGWRLRRRRQRATCTGGWIAKTLTDVVGSSKRFGEGFVTYSNEAKVRTLGGEAVRRTTYAGYDS